MQYFMADDIGVIKGDGEFIMVLEGKFFGPFPFTLEAKEKIIKSLDASKSFETTEILSEAEAVNLSLNRMEDK